MFDSIILLTDRYPYESGEAFIHNEIPFILNYCKKLYIVPVNARDYKESRLEQSEKIDVWSDNHKTTVGYKLLKVPVQIVKREIRQDIKKLRKERILNSSTLELLFYFSVEYNRVAKDVILWLKKRLNRDENVLIYSYWLYNTAYVGCKLKDYFKDVFFVSRGHRFDIYLERNRNNYLPCREYICKKINIIAPISDDGREYLTEKYPNMKGKIFTYRLGTLDYGLNPQKQDDSLSIVSCSNIIPIKRVELIVEILKHINREIIWTHFGDGEQRKLIEDKARETLPSNVRVVFKGALPNKEIMSYYQNNHCDVFINVSESEGIPVSIMEAISFGIPVIATNVGGTREIITDGINGYLIEKDFDAKEVSKLVVAISNEMRMRARKTWEERYNAEKNYREFFQSMIEASKIGEHL